MSAPLPHLSHSVEHGNKSPEGASNAQEPAAGTSAVSTPLSHSSHSDEHGSKSPEGASNAHQPSDEDGNNLPDPSARDDDDISPPLSPSNTVLSNSPENDTLPESNLGERPRLSGSSEYDPEPQLVPLNDETQDGNALTVSNDNMLESDRDVKPKPKPKMKRKFKIRVVGVKKGQEKKVKAHCDICREMFSSVHELNKHAKEHHPQFKCRVCGWRFETSNGLYKHEHSHLEKWFKCDECGKAFQFPNLLKIHSHTHLKTGLFPCTNCPKKFTVNGVMLVHADKHHNAEQFQCEQCLHKTNSKYNLQKHM